MPSAGLDPNGSVDRVTPALRRSQERHIDTRLCCSSRIPRKGRAREVLPKQEGAIWGGVVNEQNFQGRKLF